MRNIVKTIHQNELGPCSGERTAESHALGARI